MSNSAVWVRGRFAIDTALVTQSESLFYDYLRSALMLQIMLGHISAISLPHMAVLISDIPENLLLIILKIVPYIGKQSSFLFIFMSGFFAGGNVLISFLKNENIIPFKGYFFSRTGRLLPILIIALALAFILDSIALSNSSQRPYYENVMGHDVASSLNLRNFLGTILMSRPFFSEAFGTTGPLWTLCLIYQANLIFWFLLVNLSAGYVRTLIFLVILAALWLLSGFEWGLGVLMFAFGALLRITKFRTKHPLIIFAAFLLLFVASSIMPLHLAELLSMVSAPLVVCVARSASLPTNTFLSGCVKKLSEASYAIYATHLTIGCFVVSAVLASSDNDVDNFSRLLAWSIASATAILGGLAIGQVDSLGRKFRSHSKK